jgi:hypothetical protein
VKVRKDRSRHRHSFELDAPRVGDATSIVPFDAWTAALGAAGMANVPTLRHGAPIALTLLVTAIALRRIV